MDKIMLSQLNVLTGRLKELVLSAKEICNKGIIPLEDITRINIALKMYIEDTSKTIDKYANSTGTPSIDVTENSFAVLTEGRETLINLETILQTTKQKSAQTSGTKLPNLTLPKFEGKILEFSNFWERFQASVGSRNLTDAEKLTYLLGCLEGKALEAVQGLGATDANYSVAVESLFSRFGDKTLVMDAHYKALFELSKCEHTAQDCRKNIDTIERHLRILESLGENIESNHLRTLIMAKFPDKVLYEINLMTYTTKTVSSVRQALQNVIRAMEMSQSETVPIVSDRENVPSSTEALHVRVMRKRGKFQPKILNTHLPSTSNERRKRKGADVPNLGMKRGKRACIFCSGNHFNDECIEIKDLKQRKEKVQDRCYNCLMKGHRLINCRRPKKCYHCAGPHNRALCPKRAISNADVLSAKSHTMTVLKHNANKLSFLQTATVRIANRNSKKYRVLLDSGSQRSYITQKLAKQSNLTPHREDLLLIYTFGEKKPKETLSPVVDITVVTNRDIHRDISVNIVQNITERLLLPRLECNYAIDVLAEDGSAGEDIDILIGNDYYFSFLRPEKINIMGNLFLVNSDFGWIITGQMEYDQQAKGNALSVATYHQSNRECACYTEPDIPLRNFDITFLWSLENIGITDPVKATREEEAIQNFTDTVEYQEGRYYVKWPWIVYPPRLPTNYGLAYGRLKGLLQRLDLPTLQDYDSILKEQLDGKIIECIEVDKDVTNQSIPPLHYLPHHIVKQHGKRGRIVYDASAKLKEQASLNECMFRGPCMLQDLTALLLNFRLYEIGIIADVEKAFLQVGLQMDDREVTRFLWVKNINEPLSNENIVHLRFCRVPFGVIASPFLLTAVIRHHISKTNNNLLKHIANKCYVDNLVTGTNTISEASELYKVTKNVFEELSMNIRDWTSNDESFVKGIPEVDRAKPSEEIKVLGLKWNKSQDVLKLNTMDEIFNLQGKTVTKREVLRTLASIYDPCGLISPLLLPAKIFLQGLWRQDYKWDAPISKALEHEWITTVNNLKNIKGVQIPRCIHLQREPGNIEYELHCFSDASKHAYAAAVYLRGDNGHEVKTSLLMSKNRVVPLEKKAKSKEKKIISSKAHSVAVNKKKPLTIPQLELLGCVIGSRLLLYLKKTLELKITKQYMWTDSLVALSWINSKKLLTPWVANRVNEIRKNIEINMRYVNTKQNPADLATRPEHNSNKLASMWLQGPDFLGKGKGTWPDEVQPELKDTQASFSVVSEGLEKQPPDHYVETSEESPSKTVKKVTESTYRESLTYEIEVLQKNYFPEEVKGIETSLTRNLGLFVDADGLLRCKGRMKHAEWPYDMKHPILLPKDCELTMKIIRETHERNYHVGVSHTLSIIRQKFWIPQGRSQVQKVLRRCPQCVKHGGGPFKLPETPALPSERVRYEAPFACTGIDYFGPIFVKTDGGKQKRWACLLTCLVVRSIHLEVIKDLTAEECLLALRRFFAIRGIPKLILSDNALQFKLTADIMTSPYCIENKIRWKFTPELAPWHGGVYERMVAVVKNCLKRTLCKHLLNDTQLVTVLKEVESVVNTRPLTYVSSDLDYILKPADFLSFGKCLAVSPSDNEAFPIAGSTTKQDLIAGWKRGIAVLKDFKEMFINQYLTSLRERYRHSLKQSRVRSNQTPKVGDLVQIKGENKNRLNWRVGRISDLILGQDGECRVAKVKVGETEFTRSIGHLYPLEADITGDDDVRIRPVINESEPPTSVREIQEVERQEEVPGIEVDNAEVNMTEHNEIDTRAQSQDCEMLEEMRVNDDVANEETTPELALQDLGDCNRDTGRRHEIEQPEGRVQRTAAIRAREKIAEWTRQLVVLLK